MSIRAPFLRSACLPLSLLLVLVLSGCGVRPNGTHTAMTGVSLKGAVHGGQPPVSGSHVYLMAASAAGYGSASTSLIKSTSADGTDAVGSYILTQDDGSFNVSGDYQCTAGQQLYMLAEGGNPGQPGNINATQIVLMAPVGECSTVSSSTQVQINEVSTIAVAYALAGFMSSPTQVATSTTAQGATNLANAFAMVNNLQYVGNAQAVTPAGNGVVPQQEINTLANILSSCVNQSSGASADCVTLFANAKSGGTTGTAPSNTAQAAINIAHNPGSVGVDALWGLRLAQAPFMSQLTTEPTDFSLAVIYTASGMTYPLRPSVDAGGNVWVPNHFGALVKLSPVGAQLSPAGGYQGGGSPDGLGSAVDQNGNVWVTSNGGAVKYDNGGNYIGTYTGGNPAGGPSYENLAVDKTGNIWDADTGSLGVYSNSGTAISPSTGYSVGYVTDVRIDGANNVWATDKDGFLHEVGPSGSIEEEYVDGSYGAAAPVALAIDGNNKIWVADSNTNEVSQFTSSGTQSTYSGGGTNQPYCIAIDGANSAWMANLNGAVSGIGSTGTALTPVAGYAFPAANGLVFDAADGSGNLWVTVASAAKVLQYVGLTAPVVTPINPSKLGAKP